MVATEIAQSIFPRVPRLLFLTGTPFFVTTYRVRRLRSSNFGILIACSVPGIVASSLVQRIGHAYTRLVAKRPGAL